VLVMQDGRLVAQGTVAELALTCKEFQRLTFMTADVPASRDAPDCVQVPASSAAA
jgi:hypothetical protein